MSNTLKIKPSSLLVISIVSILISCELQEPDVEISIEDIIALNVDQDSLEADGQNTFKLTAELQDKTDPNKEVTFRTSYGTFMNGDNPGTAMTKIKSSGRRAIAHLKVTEDIEDRIFISAELGGFACDKEIKTIPAFPTNITISTDDLIIKSNRGNIVTTTVRLNREVGKVSNGVPVHFSFVDVDNKDLFLNFNSSELSSNQTVSTTIQSLNDSIGPIRFIIRTPSNNLGDSLKYELNLIVQ